MVWWLVGVMVTNGVVWWLVGVMVDNGGDFA